MDHPGRWRHTVLLWVCAGRVRQDPEQPPLLPAGDGRGAAQGDGRGAVKKQHADMPGGLLFMLFKRGGKREVEIDRFHPNLTKLT